MTSPTPLTIDDAILMLGSRFTSVTDFFDEGIVVNCGAELDISLERAETITPLALWIDRYGESLLAFLKASPATAAECDDCGDPAPFRLHQCPNCHKRARAEAGI